MVVLIAVCWILWKSRNDVCFNDCAPKTATTLIFLIKSLLNYWIGKMKKTTADAVKSWMLVIEDAIPLNVIPPNMELVPHVTPGYMRATPGALSGSE